MNCEEDKASEVYEPVTGVHVGRTVEVDGKT